MKYNFAKLSDEELRAITALKQVNTTMSVNDRLKIHITATTNGILSFIPNNPRLGTHGLLIPYVDAIDLSASHKLGSGFAFLGEQGIGWLGAYIIDDAGTDKWQMGYRGTGSTTITQLGSAETNASAGDKLLVLLDVFKNKVSGSLHEEEISFLLKTIINGTVLDQQIFAAANQVPHNLEYLAPGFVLTRIAGTCEMEITNMETGYNNKLLEVV